MNSSLKEIFGSWYKIFAKLGGSGLDLLLEFYLAYRTVFEFFGLALSLIFFGVVVYYIVRLNVVGFKINRYFEILNQKELSRSHSIRAWRQIKKRLTTRDQQQMKLAILEADKILDEVFKASKYVGKNMEERLSQASDAQLSSIENIRKAHELSRRIAGEADFKITYEEALEALQVYAKAFQEFGLIS